MRYALIFLILCASVFGDGAMYGGGQSSASSISNAIAGKSNAKIIYPGDDIQTAITALGTGTLAEPVTLIVMGGNYSVDSQITVGSYTNIIFDGVVIVVDTDNQTLDDQTDTYLGTAMASLFTNSDHSSGNTRIVITGRATIDFGSGSSDGVTDIPVLYDGDRTYAAIWFNDVTESRIEGVYCKDVVYNVDWTTGSRRAYGILLTNCVDIDIVDCRATGVGYEGVGIRGGNRNINVTRLHGNGNRQHLAQVASFTGSADTVTTGLGGGNEFVTFTDCQSVDDKISSISANGICVHTDVNHEYTVDSCVQGNREITLAGDNATTAFRYGQKIFIRRDGIINGVYTVESVTLDGSDTDIVVEEALDSGTVSGCTVQSTNHSISINGCHVSQFRILDNTRGVSINGGSASKIWISPGTGILEEISIQGVYVYDLGDRGVTISNISSGTVRDVYFNGMSIVGQGTNECFYLDQTGGSGTIESIHFSNINGQGYQFVKTTGSGTCQQFYFNDCEAHCKLAINGTSAITDLFINNCNFQVDMLTGGTDTLFSGTLTNLYGSGNIFSYESIGGTLTNNQICDTDWDGTYHAYYPETLSATGNAALKVPTDLVGSSAGQIITVGSGDTIGELKTLSMSNQTNAMTVRVANHETSDPEDFTFDAVDEYLTLVWTGTEWATVAATATP